MNRQKTVSKVLELKGLTKEQIELEAKKTREELNIEKGRLELLEGTLENTVTEFNSKQDNSSISTQELELFYDYVLYLQKRIAQQSEVVRRKIAELEVKQKAILEAYKEERLFEILHNKIVNEEMKEMLLVEQKEMDFNFISRKSRR